jgi:ubiquitin-protein ligase
MKIIIQPTVGLNQTAELDVDPQELVRNVKERAAVNQAYDPNGAVLNYEGKVLDDNRRLKEYGIKEGATLRLIPKNQEGGYDPPSLFFRNLPMDFKSRIAHEAKMIRARGLPIQPIDPNHWVALVQGKGKWRGKNYPVDITLSSHYPFTPPKVEWKTPMMPYHPNIFPHSGWVCLNILDRDWRPEYTLITVLCSLEWLLEHPHYEGSHRPLPSLWVYTSGR